MASTPQYRMADRLTGGALAAILAEQRAEGRPYTFIARELYILHGVEVSHETLRSWCAELGIDKGEPAEATP